MEKLAPVLGPEQLVTDVGSTKRVISETAARLFNTQERAAFLPGHPMAGKERGGAALSDANLFRGAVWLFTDDPAAKRSAKSAEFVKSWREWVMAMGAKTLDLDPVRHDDLVAWVSHLPQFTATALSALLEEEVGDAPELKDVGGRALREMTRLGASPYSMWRDIAHTNTEAVERALLALEQRLAQLRENLRTPELRSEFEEANKFRREYLKAEAPVECGCLGIDGVHQNCARSDNVRGCRNANQRVLEHGLAETGALLSAINGQPR
jgi:prephenate dehydrogenase